MKWFVLVASVIFALFSHASWAWAASTPQVPPSQDPFYTAPPRFEKFPPGTVLRLRPAPSNLTQSIPNCSAAYHILYRTTDTRYRPSWAVTTLLLPKSYNTTFPPAPVPLLSYQIPYNSVWLDASPSFDFTQMATPGGNVAESLGRGWVAVVPDFEGPTGSFGAGVQAGHATIDSIRAVLSLSQNNTHSQERILGKISRYAMWGYSGGSIATEFAAELAVQYAPELTFSGAALGGVAVDLRLTNDSETINRSPFSADLFAIFLGAMNQYPDAYAFLVDSLKESGPYNRTRFLAVEHMTIAQAFAYYAWQDIWEYFVQGRDILNAPVIKRVIERNSVMGYHGVPDMPLFMYQAIGDKLVPITNTDVLVERYCGIGATIEFQRNTIGGHISEITNGAPRAMECPTECAEGAMTSAGKADKLKPSEPQWKLSQKQKSPHGLTKTKKSCKSGKETLIEIPHQGTPV